MWMIPLPDGVMSVGAVCWPDYLKQRKGRTVEFLLDTLKLNPALWQRLENAELIGNEIRVAGNYSYDSTQMGGAGWVLIGDAFAFLDPVFSSGVYLAMSGAEQAVNVVDAALREPASRWRCCASWKSASAPAWTASRSSSTVSTALVMRRCFVRRAIMATGAERDLDARRRPIRFAESASAFEVVQTALCNMRLAISGAGDRAQVPAGPGARGVHRRQRAAGQDVKYGQKRPPARFYGLAAGLSWLPATAASAALKPVRECVPSQNGLVVELRSDTAQTDVWESRTRRRSNQPPLRHRLGPGRVHSEAL